MKKSAIFLLLWIFLCIISNNFKSIKMGLEDFRFMPLKDGQTRESDSEFQRLVNGEYLDSQQNYKMDSYFDPHTLELRVDKILGVNGRSSTDRQKMMTMINEPWFNPKNLGSSGQSGDHGPSGQHGLPGIQGYPTIFSGTTNNTDMGNVKRPNSRIVSNNNYLDDLEDYLKKEKKEVNVTETLPNVNTTSRKIINHNIEEITVEKTVEKKWFKFWKK